MAQQPQDSRDDVGRLVSQVRLIAEGLPGIASDPPGWLESGGATPLRALFREGAFLVRDRDLRRVSGLIPGQIQESLIDGLTLYAPSRMSTAEALERIARVHGRGVATPDHVVSVCPRVHCPATEPEETAAAPSDGPVPAMSAVKGCDGAGVRVSVVDTGWIKGAEKGKSWLKAPSGDIESIPQPGPIGPYVGHGTFISGVVSSMAPKAEVVHERVPQQANGAWFESDMVAQLDDALSRSPDIICLSAGTTSFQDSALLGMQVFYETRLQYFKNVVFVASAGNDGDRIPMWPAAFPWAISVGALDATSNDGVPGKRAWFSNYGSWVDVYAPGENLVNAFAKGEYVCTEPPNAGAVRKFDGMAQWSGTSFSAPLVAGLIAARMSATGLSARHAADELMAIARCQAKPGVGPVLMPGDACRPTPCACGCCTES